MIFIIFYIKTVFINIFIIKMFIILFLLINIIKDNINLIIVLKGHVSTIAIIF